MRFLASIVFAAVMWGQTGQTVSISPAPPSIINVLQPFTFSIAVAPTGTGWAGTQFVLALTNATVQSITVATPSAAAKAINCGPLSNSTACVVIGAAVPPGGGPATGLNTTSVTSAGPIANITAKAVAIGPITITLSSLAAADAAGNEITPVNGPSMLSLMATNPCDVDGNGVVDGNDVTLELSYVLKTAVPPAGKTGDRNNDGVVDVADAELVLKAAVPGGVCTAVQ